MQIKTTINLLLVLCLVSCATTKKEVAENPNFTKNLKIDKNYLQIITPKVELKEKKDGQFIQHSSETKRLRDATIQAIQLMFPKASYVEVPFMYKDARTTNAAIETSVTYKKQKAPKQLLTAGKRYSIFIYTNNYFGEIERGVINLYLIDNEKKTRQLLEHYNYKHSPLETEKFKRKVLKVLEKL